MSPYRDESELERRLNLIQLLATQQLQLYREWQQGSPQQRAAAGEQFKILFRDFAQHTDFVRQLVDRL
jgi:hypothetical protein